MAVTREIVFDTETTGLDSTLDRVVEIGCLELIDRFPTGRAFHCYVNPGRRMPEEAFAIHGLSDAFLKTQPGFDKVADPFLDFIGDAPLVAHNAMFDLDFINRELDRVGKEPLGGERVIDTLMLARRKHGGSNRLDDLCRRYNIDNSRRTKHGALLDAALLCEVYIELIGARQTSLFVEEKASLVLADIAPLPQRLVALLSRITETERKAHQAVIAALGEKAIWHDYR